VCLVIAGCGNSKQAEQAAPAKVEAPKEAAKVVTATASVPAAPGAPPEFIEFASDYGKAKFTHQKHFERVNNDCSTCHPKIFPQALEPLNYGKARHRVAEEFKTSCAACHGISGTAFAAERNCQKCHEIGLKQ